MAVAYASHSATTPVQATSVVINKPSGLSVGDLMIAHIGGIRGDGSQDDFLSLLSGWTLLRNDPVIGVPASYATYRQKIMYKIADSSDVAASTFTFSGGVFSIGGAIYRITGYAPTMKIETSDSAVYNSSTSINVDAAVTPSRGSSLILMLSGYYGANSSSGTFGNQAIATSNPTWTEDYDIRLGDASGTNSMFGAHAIRSETTSTGNISFSIEGGASVTSQLGVVTMVVVANTLDATVPLDAATVAASAPDPTITGGMIATLDVASIVSSAVDFLFAGQAKWSAKVKNSTSSFTNQSKTRTITIYE